jgi:hypothetical protein
MTSDRAGGVSMRDLWIDFNDLDSCGNTVTLGKFAEPGVDLHIGSQITVGDDDDNLCKAQVTSLGNDGTVALALDLGSFQSGDAMSETFA